MWMDTGFKAFLACAHNTGLNLMVETLFNHMMKEMNVEVKKCGDNDVTMKHFIPTTALLP